MSGFVQWANDHIVPVDPERMTFGFLDQRLDGVRMVCFGESQHYTKEFNSVSLQMMQYLVGKGFTTFVYESPFADSRAIYDYVLGADISLEDAFYKGICFTFSVWKEMRDLAVWMREYNLKNKNKPKLHYYGVDIGSCDYCGNSAYAAVRYTLDYLQKADPAYAREERALLDLAKKYTFFSFRKEKSDVRNAFGCAVTRLAMRLEKMRPVYVEKTGVMEYEWAHQSARNAIFSVECMESTALGEGAWAANNVRELCMADNIRWVLDREAPGGVFFHSHNVHIRKSRRQSGGIPTGAYIKDLLEGKGVLSICATNQLSLRPDDVCKKGSLEYLLSQVDGETFVLDLKDLSSDDQAFRELSECKMDRQNMAYMDNSIYESYDMIYFTKRRQSLSELVYRPFEQNITETDSVHFNKFTGAYRLRNSWWIPAEGETGDIITIFEENGRLYSTGLLGEDGTPNLDSSTAEHFPVDKSELIALSENMFCWTDWFGRIRFVPNGDGVCNRLEFIHYDTAWGNIIADRIEEQKAGGEK